MKVDIHELYRVNVHDICFVRFGTVVSELCPFLKLLNPYKESLCIKFLQQLSNLNGLVLFFESQIKLLENSYIDDSIVCIGGRKFTINLPTLHM